VRMERWQLEAAAQTGHLRFLLDPTRGAQTLGRYMRTAILAFGVLIGCQIAQAADLSGVPRVVDGDTLAIGATKVRLEGIDAPETDQFCLDAKGVRWTCGIEARDRLTAHIAGREISCTRNGFDAYGRTLGVCRLDGENLNAWMVQEGWALAYVRYSSAYRQAEESARSDLRGLWQGAFIAPWDWRHRNIKTVILGAYSVPINAESMLLPSPATAGAPSPDCIIKGNVNNYGERIYHMPDQQFYSRVKMDKGQGERWFCTKEEAEAAGWRRALR
jgi:endonuclease YncB( thermonuclease family)